jgi:hypothetical protein
MRRCKEQKSPIFCKFGIFSYRTQKKMYLRLISKQSIFDLQLTVTPLMHLKCPRIQTAGLLCAPGAQKNLTEQQRIGKQNISVDVIEML